MQIRLGNAFMIQQKEALAMPLVEQFNIKIDL
jgi:hypothetical protein